MAQAALSSPRQSLDSPPQDDTSLEPLHTLVSATNDSEHSAESDTPERPATPEVDNFNVLENVEEDEEKPPFPPLNVWTMPNARAPLESYKEMTLACRFVPTDQWLTTRIDRAWTVSQVKHHMLTKLWGGRRYQLPLPRNPTLACAKREPSTSRDSARLSFSSSTYSSVIFAQSLMGDTGRSFHALDSIPNASNPSIAQAIPPEVYSDDGGTPRLARSMSSENIRGRGRSASSSSLHRRGLSVGGGRGTSSHPSESILGELQREEALDRLYDRIELSVKRRVIKAARHFVLVSFSNGHVLDDKDPISSYGIKPYELLEIQPASQCIRLARRTYLEPYFESDMMYRVREGSEKHGVEWIRQLRQIQREERIKSEISKKMAALGMEENRPGSEWGTGLSAVSGKTTLEQRKEEEKKRILLEHAQKEAEKKAKRERKDAASEKWKFRKMIVEGHDLNIWKDPVHDTFPEQSWDLRRVVEVQIPRPQSPIEPPSATQFTYAALAFSSNLQTSVSTRAPEKKQTKKQHEKTQFLDQPTLHLRFSIPLASVYASLNPAGAAAVHVARLKNAAKADPGSAYLAESLASLGTSTRRIDSTDPYNQGVGFGTSTLEGAGTASLVLRLPNEQTREHLCRIIHRSAGKYPLKAKQRRKLAFEPVADLIPVPDDDPERKRPHGAPFPEWRARVLKKAIAAGRAGFLSSPAWNAQMSEATGLYTRPPRMTPGGEKGKGSAIYFEGEEEDAFAADDEDDGSLASDTEWEGWRRELELDIPPKITTLQSRAPTRGAVSLPPTQEERSMGALSVVPPENIAHTDEEARLLSPIQQTSRKPIRKSSLKMAKKMVIDGIAGKGLAMPKTNAYASWTSISSLDSINSSFHSHEEYRVGEGSDTTANQKPRLAPLVTGGSMVNNGGLPKAKSATTFSLRPNLPVLPPSNSGPLSTTLAQDSSRGFISPENGTREHEDIGPEYLGDLSRVDRSTLPGLGGGLGNPAMLPPYANRGTIVTTVSGGNRAKKSRTNGGSLRGVSWLSRSARTTDDGASSGQESRRTSGSNVATLVRGISKRDY